MSKHKAGGVPTAMPAIQPVTEKCEAARQALTQIGLDEI